MKRDILLETIQEDAAEVFSISEIAQASADTFQPLAEADGKSLTAEIRIRGVQENFFRLFSILLDNALSYTPAGGSIRLSLQAASDKITLRVADSGAGIPDSEKKAIFGRFYRCDKSHEDKSHFGLGLCIAWEFIHMHKGKLWVEDTPGGGATFVAVIGGLL